MIRVEEFPDEETEAEMELESPFDILGLYRGVALPQQSVSDPRTEIDMVFLYRRPILDYWCETGEDLAAVVRHVLIHEIGHHLGFSDEDMERIEERIEQRADAALSSGKPPPRTTGSCASQRWCASSDAATRRTPAETRASARPCRRVFRGACRGR